MMKIEEFNDIMEQLQNFYDKEITDDIQKIWYNEFKDPSFERFKLIISKIYKTNKFMPRLADLIEVNNHLGTITNSTPKESKEKCPVCHGDGYIIYKKMVKNGDKTIWYDFMAVCDYCKKYPQYKGWENNDDHKTNYFTPLASEIPSSIQSKNLK